MLSSPGLLCTISLEDQFGPQVGAECLDGFDFTLLFEESMFSISISAILLVVIPLRIAYLIRKPRKVVSGVLQLVKLVRVIQFAIAGSADRQPHLAWMGHIDEFVRCATSDICITNLSWNKIYYPSSGCFLCMFCQRLPCVIFGAHALDTTLENS